MRMLFFAVCIVVGGLAHAAEWHVIGTTKERHDAKDSDSCASLNDDQRAQLLQMGGSCSPSHTDAYTETRKFLVDLDSIHREGPYLYHWAETDISRSEKHWRKESRSLVVTDCDEQKTKLIEYISYPAFIDSMTGNGSSDSSDKVISHFIYGEKACPLFDVSDTPCWPVAWGTPTWERIVPDSIGEEELHFVCSTASKRGQG